MAEQLKAEARPHSAEAWAPWLDAAARVQAAITAHAEATGQNRFDVEAELKRVVRHPEEPDEG